MTNKKANKTELLKERLQQIAKSLESNGNALGLLGLGSAGNEIDRMDEYSDLDFFAIVADGFKHDFINHLNWLSDCHPIAWCFRNSYDGYKLLFEDGVFCEFAVFESHELNNIPYSEGQFIWKRDWLPDHLRTPNVSAHNRSTDKEFLLGELLTNLYVGLCRFRRGEKCSAMRFTQVYALDRLIDILDLDYAKAESIYEDTFCPDRRIEARHPEQNELLQLCTQGTGKLVDSAEAMLNFVVNYYEVNETLEAEIRNLIRG